VWLKDYGLAVAGLSYCRKKQGSMLLLAEIIQLGYLCRLSKTLFSAAIATLKSLTDTGIQRLRILRVWVVVLLPSPPASCCVGAAVGC